MYIICFNTYLLDIDECLDPSTDDCDLNADCIDKEGYHICVCHQGYIGNGWQCYGKKFHMLDHPAVLAPTGIELKIFGVKSKNTNLYTMLCSFIKNVNLTSL